MELAAEPRGRLRLLHGCHMLLKIKLQNLTNTTIKPSDTLHLYTQLLIKIAIFILTISSNQILLHDCNQRCKYPQLVFRMKSDTLN
jgi:hypothetical protein